MAVNKLLPFANGVGANVADYDTWSALTTLLSQGFTTGLARSDYANRLFAQGALASYILGRFVVDQTAQDADLNESVFYTNFKNALVNYIKQNAVSLNTAQTIGGVKTFTSSPIVPTADTGDNTQKVATTAFVKNAVAKSTIAPVGSYIYFAGSSVPDHYLLCNGAAVSRTDYADLYAVIGDTYGAGDGSTTFNLPNSIDKFLEGSGTAGTEIAAGLPNIFGNITSRPFPSYGNIGILAGDGAFGASSADTFTTGTTSGNVSSNRLNFDASRSSAVYGQSVTVQPPALTALPCIRYE